MPGYRIHTRVATLVFAIMAIASMSAVHAVDDRLYSSMRTVNAVSDSQGYHLVPVLDYQPTSLPGDLAPPQVFEIIRPNDEQITIGRLFTSCSCIRLETEKRIYYPGERAILILRNIRNTPPAGQLYGLYIQITRPIRATLQINTFVQTGSAAPAPGASGATAAAPSAPAMPAVVTPPPLKRGGPAVLVDEELDTFEATGDVPEVPEAADESAQVSDQVSDENTVEIPGLNSPAAATAEAEGSESPSENQAEGLGELPRVDGIPSEAEGAADVIPVPEPDEEAEAAQESVRTEEDAALELPEGADVGESLGSARDQLANLFAAAEGEGAEAAANVDTARQAMESYFRQGGDAPADMDGDIPDFYAHVPAEGAGTGAGEAALNADAALRAASGLDPTLGVQAAAEPAVSAASAPEQTVSPAPERNPNSRKPVQAVTLITVGVRDMADSIRFYEALGWRRASPTKYDQTAFFQLQGQILALYPMRDQLREQNMADAAPAPGGITLALHVQDKADVWAVYQRFMDAGGTSLRVPVELPSGAVTSYVADPDGNPWEVSWVPQFRIDEGGGLWLP